MHRSRKRILFLAAFSLLACCLAACEKGSTPGENLDRALDKTGEKVKDAGEAIKPR